jgi:hypothetical protein
MPPAPPNRWPVIDLVEHVLRCISGLGFNCSQIQVRTDQKAFARRRSDEDDD